MHPTAIDPTTAADLHALATLTGRPEDELLRAAVAAYLEDQQDIRAAAAALKELQDGAKPLTLSELDEYLSRDVAG